jgi:hypothetical protein
VKEVFFKEILPSLTENNYGHSNTETIRAIKRLSQISISPRSKQPLTNIDERSINISPLDLMNESSSSNESSVSKYRLRTASSQQIEIQSIEFLGTGDIAPSMSVVANDPDSDPLGVSQDSVDLPDSDYEGLEDSNIEAKRQKIDENLVASPALVSPESLRISQKFPQVAPTKSSQSVEDSFEDGRSNMDDMETEDDSYKSFESVQATSTQLFHNQPKEIYVNKEVEFRMEVLFGDYESLDVVDTEFLIATFNKKLDDQNAAIARTSTQKTIEDKPVQETLMDLNCSDIEIADSDFEVADSDFEDNSMNDSSVNKSSRKMNKTLTNKTKSRIGEADKTDPYSDIVVVDSDMEDDDDNTMIPISKSSANQKILPFDEVMKLIDPNWTPR